MRFYINILATYFPDIDPPYEVYYEQILEQVALAEELGVVLVTEDKMVLKTFPSLAVSMERFLGHGQ